MRRAGIVSTQSGEMGRWSVVASGSYESHPISREITWFRGVPIQISAISWTDPFGPSTATLMIPSVSLLERVPAEDTWWLTRGTRIDIRYDITHLDTFEAIKDFDGFVRPSTLSDAQETAIENLIKDYMQQVERIQSETGHLPTPDQVQDLQDAMEEAIAAIKEEAGVPAEEVIMSRSVLWEGIVTSRTWSSQAANIGVTLECIGAMRVLEHRQAPQILFSHPHPYEWVIGRHFTHAEENHPTGLAPMRIEWPDWWTRNYTPDLALPDYLRPAEVTPGYPWTGLTTREFGRWDEVLSSAIQSLLSVMFTEKGQFTLMLDPGRVPVLKHRDRITQDTDRTLHVDATWPGVEMGLTEDDSQTANVIYGEARSAISGASYKGLHYTIDGTASGFDPLAIHGSVDTSSALFDPDEMRMELYVNFSDGMTPAEAMDKARNHIQRNAAAGLTGNITLTGIDPQILHPDGEMVPFPAVAIRAGDTIRVHGLKGSNEGVLFHIVRADIAPESASATLTVDTKYRDYMTVREVLDRGRDALRPWHLMTVGKYNINIPDAMLRWNYEEGSGFIPYESFTGGFWIGAPNNLPFPWTDWTRKHPPKEVTWSGCYLKVPAIQYDPTKTVPEADATNNWNRPESLENQNGCYVLLAQAGEIALLQIAAYDAEGNVKKVPFHVSIWASNHASAKSSPLLHEDTTVSFTDADGSLKQVTYGDGQPYPFFEDAWEQTKTDGSQGSWVTDAQPSDDGLLVGYGNHWEKAGYWPYTGRSETSDISYPDQNADRATPTGLLVDESGWSFDMSQFSGFSLNDPSSNSLVEHANATILVYCESTTDTFFLGRLYRKEYGA